MGQVLPGLASHGVSGEDRSVRLFSDKLVDAFKACGEAEREAAVVALVEAIDRDEVHHGGLLSRETLMLNNEVRKG